MGWAGLGWGSARDETEQGWGDGRVGRGWGGETAGDLFGGLVRVVVHVTAGIFSTISLSVRASGMLAVLRWLSISLCPVWLFLCLFIWLAVGLLAASSAVVPRGGGTDESRAGTAGLLD